MGLLQGCSAWPACQGAFLGQATGILQRFEASFDEIKSLIISIHASANLFRSSALRRFGKMVADVRKGFGKIRFIGILLDKTQMRRT